MGSVSRRQKSQYCTKRTRRYKTKAAAVNLDTDVNPEDQLMDGTIPADTDHVENTTGDFNMIINNSILLNIFELSNVPAAAEVLCETHEYAAVRSAAYDCILNKLHPLYVQAGEESMAKAAANISTDHNDNNNQGPKDIVASFDGSWQRRGYASLNGIVLCIERTKMTK